MSSHHFVKEGQEPALFILDTFSFGLVEPLLEWVPLVIVADHVLEHVLQWGIKIDVVLQHENSINELEDTLRNQSPVQIHPCASKKILMEGLQFLIRNKNKAVNLVALPTPDLFSELESFIHQIRIGIYCDGQKWSAVASGKFEKWMPVGSKVAIRHDLTDTLEVQGLIKQALEWKTISERIVIQSKSPFWIMETL